MHKILNFIFFMVCSLFVAYGALNIYGVINSGYMEICDWESFGFCCLEGVIHGVLIFVPSLSGLIGSVGHLKKSRNISLASSFFLFLNLFIYFVYSVFFEKNISGALHVLFFSVIFFMFSIYYSRKY